MAQVPPMAVARQAGSGGSEPSEPLLPPPPIENLHDALPQLRRPFTPEAVRFKVQTVFGGNTGCIVVAYIDARLVIERLNKIAEGNWSAAYRFAEPKAMWCDLTVFGVTRSDLGEAPKGLSKDIVSDSLKRAAVHFGVGVSIYALPQITLFMRDGQRAIELRGKAPKQTLALTEHGHVKLREGYAKWLEDHGRAKFGEPLDHGDIEGATVDEETESEPVFVPEPPAPLEDDRAKDLIAQAEALYDEIRAVPEGAAQLPPGQFNAWKSGAAHSHDELERFVHFLRERRDSLKAAA